MKAHIGVDVASGVCTRWSATAANEADINSDGGGAARPEEAVFADAGYTGAEETAEHADREVSWNIAIKRGIIKALPKVLRDLAEPVERGAVTGARLGRAPLPHRQEPVPPQEAALSAAWPRIPRSYIPCLPGQPGDRQEALLAQARA